MGALRHLIPLFVILVVVAGAGYIGYQFYLWSTQLADRGLNKLEKKHVKLTKDGVKVEVKGVSEEEYAARQQDYLVKAWNLSSLPAYKSRFWNLEEQAKQKELAKQKQGKTTAVAPQQSEARPTASSAAQNNVRPAAPRASSSNVGAFPDY